MKTKSLFVAAAILLGIASCSKDDEENIYDGNDDFLNEILENADTTHLMEREQMPSWLIDMFSEWEDGYNYRYIYQGETPNENIYYIPNFASSDLFDSFYHQDGTRFKMEQDKAIPKPISGWTLIYIWYREGFESNKK